jgi:hypothetical protein
MVSNGLQDCDDLIPFMSHWHKCHPVDQLAPAWLATGHQQKSANQLSSGSCGRVIHLNSCNKPSGDHMNNTFKINLNISRIWGKHYLKDEQFTLQVQPILGCSRYSLVHTIRVNLHLKLESHDPMAASRSVVEDNNMHLWVLQKSNGVC